MSKISVSLDEQNNSLDISTLTKKGIKRILLTPWSDVLFDKVQLDANKQHDITFPELNGTLPSYIQLSAEVEKWNCGCRIMELAGKGNRNYFNIAKENDNGVPTYGLDSRK